jgi:hypothetical protein
MAIIRAAVGDNLREFGDDSGLEEVWAFIDMHMATSQAERPIVLMEDGGATIGEIWESSLYLAQWGAPEKLRAYLDLVGFDQEG